MSTYNETELLDRYGRLNTTLEGVDGNAFALMAHFRQHARHAGWDREDISRVLDEAMSGDYNHLVATLATFTKG
jgi:hypothetical protein